MIEIVIDNASHTEQNPSSFDGVESNEGVPSDQNRPHALQRNMSGNSIARVPSNHEKECTICLSNPDGNELVTFPGCQHRFHNACLEEWLEQGTKTCPNCRGPLESPTQPLESPTQPRESPTQPRESQTQTNDLIAMAGTTGQVENERMYTNSNIPDLIVVQATIAALIIVFLSLMLLQTLHILE